MNQNDINCAFTEKVTELLDRGYQIYPGTMGGSQGEIAHIDLYNSMPLVDEPPRYGKTMMWAGISYVIKSSRASMSFQFFRFMCTASRADSMISSRVFPEDSILVTTFRE